MRRRISRRPQRVRVEGLVRRHPVKARMGALTIEKIEIPAQRSARFGDGVVGLEVDLLVLQRSPEPLDEHVVAQAPLTSMLMAIPFMSRMPVNASLGNWHKTRGIARLQIGSSSAVRACSCRMDNLGLE